MGRRRKFGNKKVVLKSPKPDVTKDELEEEESENEDTKAQKNASDTDGDSNPSLPDVTVDDGINNDDLVSENDEEEEKQECSTGLGEDNDNTSEMKIIDMPGHDLGLEVNHNAETQKIELVDEKSTTAKTEKEDTRLETRVENVTDGPEVPEVLSSLGLTVSPSAKSKANSSPSLETTTNEELGPSEETLASEEPIGKLRSSVADAEGNALAKGYRHRLRETEEYALNYMCTELHHPVISCFRELTKTDVLTIIGNRQLKKSCNSLELSVVYLGLIDLFAAVNNNPLYGDNCNAKFSKSASNAVQKILLDFKNIIGLWALSGNENLNNRYITILRYLRRMVPMFRKTGFEQEFGSIIDRIESEVQRCKSNQEKLKSMNSPSIAFLKSENSVDKAASLDSQDGEVRSALNEIILNVNLNIKEDDSDDEDVTVLSEDKTQIFGKPLKASPKTSEVRKPKKHKKLTDTNKESSKSTGITKKNENNVMKTPTSSHVPAKANTLPKPKTLASVFQTTSSPKAKIVLNKPSLSLAKNTNKSVPMKRNANEEITTNNETTKKRKLDESPDSVVPKEKMEIKNFFQTKNKSVDTVSSKAKEPVASTSPDVPKPTVNAFALMMNRSREMAQKKKLDKLSTPQRPAVKT
ncbi:unnamed protein product [Orchesella dallaii]|uniref:Uncharacterized protein n=1 Tax=Orchesella dallaii TaxID=48710 RepID=A0ABP1RX68_9HEXA